MAEREILTRLQDFLGPSASYELDAHAPTPQERRQIQENIDEAAADAADAEIEMESMLPRNLWGFTSCDPRVRSRYLSRTALVDSLSARTLRRRVRVGRRGKSGFKLVAQGDDWNEVFAKLRKKRGR